MTWIRPTRHARTHRPGGSDPVASESIWYASKITSARTDVTTPWNVDGSVPQNGAGMTTNDAAGDYFENMTDENGIHGIKILQEGFYLFRLRVNVFVDVTAPFTTAGTIPPYIRAEILLKANAEGSGFGEGGFTEVCGINHITNGPAYLPDEDADAGVSTLTDQNRFVIRGDDWFQIRDIGSGLQQVPISFAWRIWSLGATENWSYTGRFEAFRLFAE